MKLVQYFLLFLSLLTHTTCKKGNPLMSKDTLAKKLNEFNTIKEVWIDGVDYSAEYLAIDSLPQKIEFRNRNDYSDKKEKTDIIMFRSKSFLFGKMRDVYIEVYCELSSTKKKIKKQRAVWHDGTYHDNSVAIDASPNGTTNTFIDPKTTILLEK